MSGSEGSHGGHGSNSQSGRSGTNGRPQVSPSRAVFMPDSPGMGRIKKEASPCNSEDLSRLSVSVSQVRNIFPSKINYSAK